MPHGDGAAHIVGGLKDMEMAVVEGVGDQGGGQVEDGVAIVGEDGEHGHHAHMAIAHHVVDEQYLFHNL